MVQMYYKHSVTVDLAQRLPFRALADCCHKKCERITVMSSSSRFSSRRWETLLASLWFLSCLSACNRSTNTIAVIPRACGTALWEPEHAGAAHVARRKGMNVYWNAPTREDDVAGQIALLEKVVARGYAGIIITPDQTLPLRSPSAGSSHGDFPSSSWERIWVSLPPQIYPTF